MKNNKFAPYILGPILLIVWGLVFYKIYQAVYGGETNFSMPTFAKIPVIEGPIEESPYALLLDYNDPFLGKKIRGSSLDKATVRQIKNSNSSPPRPVQKNKTISPPKLPFPTVIYQGFQVSELDTIASLKINNRFYPIAREGNRYQGVEIQHIYKDSIQLNYKNQNRTFIRKR